MPLLNGLDFTQHNLRVAYRASAEPQVMTIDIGTAGKALRPMAGGYIWVVRRWLRSGVAGSDIFPPWLPWIEKGVEPETYQEETGPSYHFEIPHAAFAPLMIRLLVELFRKIGVNQPVEGMVIRGSLPLDDSPLSITERDVKRWLDDPTAYPRVWPDLGFEVIDRSAVKGAFVRVRLVDDLPPGEWDTAYDRVGRWFEVLKEYVSEADHGPVPIPTFELTEASFARREVVYRLEKFPYVKKPSRDLLLNTLCRFHHEVARIESVEVAL